MDKDRKRIRAIEVSLTPPQIVLLWMKNALKGTYSEGAMQRPPARESIANSVLRAVSNGLKGLSDDLIERAVLQGRREADVLYNLVIDINVLVQEALPQRSREYLFLLGFVDALIRGPVTSDSEQEFRELTLLFVEEILLLDGAISQVSADQFDGQPILFYDSAAKLKEQTDLVEQALKHFNRLAEQLKFAELRREEICDRLRAEVDQQVWRWLIVARSAMLAEFGEHAELIANFKQLLPALPASSQS